MQARILTILVLVALFAAKVHLMLGFHPGR